MGEYYSVQKQTEVLCKVGFAKERNDKYKDMKPLPLTIQRSVEVTI